MQRDRYGEIVDWGPPNDKRPVKMEDFSEEVDAWKFLWVQVRVRDTLLRKTGWMSYQSFWASTWSDIPHLFDRYWGTAGVYHRAQFNVEGWVWTNENKWEIDDRRYIMQRDRSGEFVDRGPPNDKCVVQIGDSVQKVDAWKLLWVQVCVRDTLTHITGWPSYQSFWADTWSIIPVLFDTYHGIYHRAQFKVECWFWTNENKWEIDDHL